MSANRVLVIYGSSDLYGASKNLIRSLIGFKRLGWTSITVLPHEGPLVKMIQDLGFEIMILDHGVLRRQNLNPLGLIRLFSQLIKSFFLLSRIIKKEKISLIYTNSNANIIGGILRFRHKIPHIWHIHEIIESPKWFKTILELFIKLTEDQVICVSEAVRANFTKIPPHKLKLLYNGIDVSLFAETRYDLKKELGLSEEKILIGMIARVNLWKGQFYFLEIAAKLKLRYPNLHFVLAGDAFTGYEFLYNDLKNHIQNLNLKNCVTNLGFRDDVHQILNGIDIFVLPSILPDPLPTTVLEAMAAGRPVIATNHGGAKEMVLDGETGFLIPWDQPDAAMNAFEKLIDSVDLRQKMGSAGQSRTKMLFNQEKYFENFGLLVSQAKIQP